MWWVSTLEAREDLEAISDEFDEVDEADEIDEIDESCCCWYWCCSCAWLTVMSHAVAGFSVRPGMAAATVSAAPISLRCCGEVCSSAWDLGGVVAWMCAFGAGCCLASSEMSE